MNKIKIYQKAIELLENAQSDLDLGLCNIITEAILMKEHRVSYREALYQREDAFDKVWDQVHNLVYGYNSNALEIARHKPEIIYGYGYWFDPYDRTSRIEILNKAIVELQENGYKAD